MSTRRVAVVGAGIVGLSSALGAAESGATVTVIDPSVGTGATHAAAGMLSPGSEFLGGFQPDYDNAKLALLEWRKLADSLGIPIHDCETEVVGWTSGDRRDIERYLSVARNAGVTVVPPSPGGFDVSPRITRAAAIAHEGFVDVDEVVAAMRRKLLSAGVEFRPETATNVASTVQGFIVSTESNEDEFERVLIATGASKPNFIDGGLHTIQSIRGVTLRIEMAPGRPSMLRAIIDGRSVYLVRRPNGSTVIGATSDLQSSAVVQTRDVLELLEMASRLVPAVQEARFIEARAGIRPASSNGLHFFHVAARGLAWTSGYFRHGVLMAPLAVARAREFVCADS